MPFAKNNQDGEEERWRFIAMPYGLISIPSMAGYCVKCTVERNYSSASEDTNPFKRVRKLRVQKFGFCQKLVFLVKSFCWHNW